MYLLHHVLTESASKYPDKEAIAFKNDSITYSELERESTILAHSLSKIGVVRGDRVGIYMDRSISSIIGAFGIMKAGATYVPVDPVCPPDRFNYIVDKCGIKSILTIKEKLTSIEKMFSGGSSLENILVMNGLDTGNRASDRADIIKWDDVRDESNDFSLSLDTTDRDVAYILFTSGSTGNPKGVTISHRNALTFVNSAHDLFEITVSDRISNICPLHFDMSVFDIFVTLKGGATLVIIPETTAVFPIKLAELIASNKLTVWNSVPSALSLLATCKNLGDHDLSSLRLVLFAGERFPLKYLRILRNTVPGARFCNMYGQTEANSSTYYWVEKLPPDDRTPLPIGRALPNFEVFALDNGGKQVIEPEEEGELYVRSSSVAFGYWGDIERTEKSFVKDPLRPDLNDRVYKTGDMVRMDADGNYIFVGRKDQMIKSRGYRIEIGEIESVLYNHPNIRNAVVIPVPDELLGNRISVIVAPVAPGKISKEDILQFCSHRLPRYMMPDYIEIRDSLPVTSTGKVDRQKLSDRDNTVSCP